MIEYFIFELGCSNGEKSVKIVINSVCDMERLTVLIQTTPNLYKMCGACAIC